MDTEIDKPEARVEDGVSFMFRAEKLRVQL